MSVLGLIADRLRTTHDGDRFSPTVEEVIEEGAPRRYGPTEDDLDPNELAVWSKQIPVDCPFDSDCPGDFKRLGPVGMGTAWRCTQCDQAFTLYPAEVEVEEV